MINNKTINGNDNVDKTDETSEGKTETNNNNEDVQNNVSPELDEEITEDHKDESSLNKEYSKSDKKHLDDIKKLKKELTKKEEEISKNKEEIESLTDLLKRRQADFENIRKRMIKDQTESRKLGIRDIALDIININDDILRSIDAASNITNKESLESMHNAFIDGIKMISNRIEETLKNYDIVEIDSINQEFDPNFNEAVEIDSSDEVNCDTITKVHQKGFRLDDCVVRCAKVKVTKPQKKETEEEEVTNNISNEENDNNLSQDNAKTEKTEIENENK